MMDVIDEDHEPLKAIIRLSLDHYDHYDAIFLAERLHAELDNEESVYLLATCHYRSGKTNAAYSILTSFNCKSPQCRLLLARCCFELAKYKEAELALTSQSILPPHPPTSSTEKLIANEFGDSAAFAAQLLGMIYSKTERPARAAEYLSYSLKLNPFLWRSFECLTQLTQTKTHPESIFTLKDNTNLMETLTARQTCTTGLVTPQQQQQQQQTVNNASDSTSTSLRRSSRLFSTSSISVKENNKTPAIKSFVCPNAPPRKIRRTGSTVSGVITSPGAVCPSTSTRRLFSTSISVKENNKTPATRSFICPNAPPRKIRRTNTATSVSTAIVEQQQQLQQQQSTPMTRDNSNNNIPASSARPTSASFVGCNKRETILDILAQLGKALDCLAHYELDDVVALLKLLPERHFNTGWVYCCLGRAYYEKTDYRESVKYYELAHQREPYRLSGMEYYSSSLWHLHNEVKLSMLAQELIEFDKLAPETWCVAGNCFSLQKEHETAIKFLERALQVDPSFAYAYTLLGHELMNADDRMDQAMTCFRNAIRLDHRHYNAWYGLGCIYYKKEKWHLAEMHHRKALKISPTNPVLMCHIAVVQHACKRSDAAIETLSKALKYDPKNALCKFHRATIYFATDQNDKALEDLADLRQLEPKESMVYFLTGKVHKKMKNNHLALINFSWAIELDPKGTNNTIKEMIDKQYAAEEDGIVVHRDQA